MQNSYLQDIKKRERRLELEQERLDSERDFYKNCSKFSQFDIDQTCKILERVSKLISVHEGEEYVYHEFRITEKGHYETEYYSRLAGLPNISGAELAASQESRQVWKEPKTYSKRMLVKKATCDIFSRLAFQNHSDYFSNLDKILEDQKYFEVKGGFGPEDFAEKFPYVKKYLGSLVHWRLEHHTLTIPVKVMDELLNVPEQPEEKKLSKRNPVSQKKQS